MDTFKTILFPNIVFRFLSLAFRQARPQRCFRLDKSNKIALNTLYPKNVSLSCSVMIKWVFTCKHNLKKDAYCGDFYFIMNFLANSSGECSLKLVELQI